MRRRVAGLCVGALMLSASAQAQTATSSAATESTLGGRLFVNVEAQAMTAKQTFDAVTGTSTLTGFGAGLDVDGIWRSAFARIALSRFSKTGERVFVSDDGVFPLGLPVDITMTPIEVAAGWRFKPMTSRAIVPYLGGGMLFLKFREQSDDDVPGESVNESYKGFTVFGGIEVPVWNKVSAGAELGWRKAKVEEPGGAMSAFGENDLGGVTVRVMLSFRK